MAKPTSVKGSPGSEVTAKRSPNANSVLVSTGFSRSPRVSPSSSQATAMGGLVVMSVICLSMGSSPAASCRAAIVFRWEGRRGYGSIHTFLVLFQVAMIPPLTRA